MGDVGERDFTDLPDNGTSGVRKIISDEGAIDLAERIVEGIATDFRSAYQFYLSAANEKELRESKITLETMERLIRSQYFSTLLMAQISPDAIIETLKRQVEREMKR